MIEVAFEVQLLWTCHSCKGAAWQGRANSTGARGRGKDDAQQRPPRVHMQGTRRAAWWGRCLAMPVGPHCPPAREFPALAGRRPHRVSLLYTPLPCYCTQFILGQIPLAAPVDFERAACSEASGWRLMAALRSIGSLLPKVGARRIIIPLGSQALPTAAAAPGSPSIPVTSGHVHFDASGCFEFNLWQRIERSEALGGLRRPNFGTRRCRFGSLAPQSRLQSLVLSRCYAVAQPFPEDLEMDQEQDDEVGNEEVIEGCRVRHGELWNEDVKIHYVECGDKNGDLVVLVHGFPNFWYVWKNQFQALAEAGYHVVAPDLRGYNSSSKPKGIPNYSRRLVVSDIVQVIDQLGNGKPATVVGHDWGGFVTWAVAEDFPNKVKNAVTVNVTHISVFAEAVRSNFRQLRQSWYIGFFQLPWLPEWFMTVRNFKYLKASFSNAICQPIDIDRHVRAYEKVGAAEGAINYYRAAVRGHWTPAPDTPRPIRVELPVDIIWGELDQYLRKELAVIPRAIAPNAVVKSLPHCSHWPMWDDPKQFNAILLESLSSKRATSGNQVQQ